jgi:hypothetical protein
LTVTAGAVSLEQRMIRMPRSRLLRVAAVRTAAGLSTRRLASTVQRAERVREVRAQIGGTIATNVAAALIADADGIRAVLGC